MSTVYDYDLHDLGQSAFQSIQERALLEQSLRDTTPDAASTPAPTSTPAPSPAPAPPADRPGGLMKKLVIGAAIAGVVGGVLYIGSRALSSERKA